METGTKISIGLHGVILGLAAFGGPLFDSDESKAIQVSEVSIITSTEFDGMISRAPAPKLQEPQQPQSSAETESAQAPVVEQPVVEQPAPEPQAPAVVETAPDVTDLAEVAKPSSPVESPEIADQAQEATGSTLVVPDAQVAEEDRSGQVSPDQLALLRPKPRPAPRVDNKVAPKPPTDAETSKETVESTTPSETPAEPTETKEEVAPKESTTEIVTEADEDPNSLAPVKSSRPKGRPSDIVAKAQAIKDAAVKATEQAATDAANDKAAADKAKTDKASADKAAADKAAAAKVAEAKAAKDAQAKAIEAAMKAATAEAAQSVGPPLTGREQGALVLAVQQCWTPPIGVQDAADLVVTLSVELTPDGKLVGSPKLVEPSGTPQGLVQQAYEAGRRALIRCAPYDLPKEKYEQWRRIEVVFNPQKMVVR